MGYKSWHQGDLAFYIQEEFIAFCLERQSFLLTPMERSIEDSLFYRTKVFWSPHMWGTVKQPRHNWVLKIRIVLCQARCTYISTWSRTRPIPSLKENGMLLEVSFMPVESDSASLWMTGWILELRKNHKVKYIHLLLLIDEFYVGKQQC